MDAKHGQHLGLNILYAVDLGNGTALTNTFDAGDQTKVRLPKLANNSPYRVSVVAYSQTSIPDPNHPGTNLVTSHMSTPSTPIAATTGIASPPIVQVTAPNGGELIPGNSDLNISWFLDQGGDVVNQKIEISTDAGVTYTPIDQTLDATARNFVWHVPMTIQTSTARVRITALDGSGNVGIDTNDADFRIKATPVGVTVSGRVSTPDGRGLRNATVSITDPQGGRQFATTSSFGFFTFANVLTGDTYSVRVSSRLYRFAVQNVQVNGALTMPDFVGLE